MRVQLADVLRGVLDFIRVHAQRAADLGKPVAAERPEVVAHNPGLERLALTTALELEQQALAEVARADAGRVEALHGPERGLVVTEQAARAGGQFLERALEVAVWIQVAADDLGGFAHLGRQAQDVELLRQLVGQRAAGGQRVEQVLALLLGHVGLLEGRLARADGRAPFLVHLHEALQGGVQVVHRRGRRAFAGGVHLRVRGRLGGVNGRAGGIVQAAVTPLPLAGPFGGGDFLEHGIAGELLLDEGAQLHHRRLEERQRLLHLGRQHLLQAQALGEDHALRHPRRASGTGLAATSGKAAKPASRQATPAARSRRQAARIEGKASSSSATSPAGSQAMASTSSRAAARSGCTARAVKHRSSTG